MAQLPTWLAAVDQYAATAHSLLNRKPKSDKSKRWLAYSSAVGSALALAGSADAGIIYSGPQNISVSVKKGGSSSGRASLLINKFVVESVDLNNFVGGGSFGSFAGLRRGSNVYVPGHNNYVRRLAAGQAISAGIAGGFRINAGSVRGAFMSRSGRYFQLGDWPATTIGFAGFRYYDASNQPHYGWIRLSLQGIGGNNPAPQATLTAVDWAYEDTPNTPIPAGDTGAAIIPEPGTLALAALAAGAVGVCALRRRKQTHTPRAFPDAPQTR
jgi:hypothetical protein